ncbi:Ig-like domain-containing protein [Lacticaseibacillus pantheris]|uniref:Ig-like domain-containing protein n=1 Tax=Lacticaseibacillus pantheris TaxID=171523 RepID=UPI003B84AD83
MPSTTPGNVDVTNDGTKTTITGTGTPGSTIKVTDGNGNTIATGTVGDDGKFTITIDDGKIKPGDKLNVTQNTNGTDSAPVTITVPSQGASNVDVTTNPDGSVDITGEGKPGSTVTITDGNGHTIGTGTVGDDGKFHITIPAGTLKPGDTVGVTVTTDGVPSKTVTVTVPAQGATNVTVTTNPDGSVDITGEGKPGSTVTITDGKGNTIATGTVGDDGKFHITIPSGILKPGDSVGVTLTTDGVPSKTTTVTVPNTTSSNGTNGNGSNGTGTNGTGSNGNGSTTGTNGSGNGTSGNGSSTGTNGNGSSTGSNGSGTTTGTNGSTTGNNLPSTGSNGLTATKTGLGAGTNGSTSSASGNSLPATGDDEGAYLAVAGTIAIGLVGLLGAEGMRRRRRED